MGDGSIDPFNAGVAVANRPDSVRGTITLFAGGGSRAKPMEYDTANGSLKDTTPAALPAGWPTPSPTGAAVAYDADRGVLVILTQDGEVFERASR